MSEWICVVIENCENLIFEWRCRCYSISDIEILKLVEPISSKKFPIKKMRLKIWAIKAADHQ